MEKVYLLLGSNTGNLKENLLKANEELANNGIKIFRQSKIYKTRPVGKTDQPDFLNMVLEVETTHVPHELLAKIKTIESQMGRTAGDKWGPRIIDIDILFYGPRMVNEKGLTIPHPQFYNRPFAIILLAEVAPDYTPPFASKKIKEFLPGASHEGIEVYSD